MANNKDEIVKRKKSVLTLYLMGNLTDEISETLALPSKTVKRDLKSLGIRAVDDARKDEGQIIEEARQEIELVKQELWKLYPLAKGGEEKRLVLEQIGELVSKKAELACILGEEVPEAFGHDRGKSLWKAAKEEFLGGFKEAANEPKAATLIAPAAENAAKDGPESRLETVRINDEPKKAVCEAEAAASDFEEKPTKNIEEFLKPVPCPKKEDNGEIEVVEIKELKKPSVKAAKKEPDQKEKELSSLDA
ncbi:MAG: hypothetical protein ACP5E4_03960 [Candidatus Aenigmatarchaeota archaeon]